MTITVEQKRLTAFGCVTQEVSGTVGTYKRLYLLHVPHYFYTYGGSVIAGTAAQIK
jgi:hypothetical protein